MADDIEFEGRVQKLETLMKRALRRVPDRIGVAATPFPVSMFWQESPDGVAARYMFPTKGTVTKVCFFVEDAEEELLFSATLRRFEGTAASQTFNIPKSGLLVEVDLQVKAGDRLEVKVPPGTKKVWSAMLWKPALADHVLRTFALEEVEHAAARAQEVLREVPGGDPGGSHGQGNQ